MCCVPVGRTNGDICCAGPCRTCRFVKVVGSGEKVRGERRRRGIGGRERVCVGVRGGC